MDAASGVEPIAAYRMRPVAHRPAPNRPSPQIAVEHDAARPADSRRVASLTDSVRSRRCSARSGSESTTSIAVIAQVIEDELGRDTRALDVDARAVRSPPSPMERIDILIHARTRRANRASCSSSRPPSADRRSTARRACSQSPSATLSYVIEECGRRRWRRRDTFAQALAIGSRVQGRGARRRARPHAREDAVIASDAVPLRDAWKSLPAACSAVAPTGRRSRSQPRAAMISIATTRAADRAACGSSDRPASRPTPAATNRSSPRARCSALTSDGGAPPARALPRRRHVESARGVLRRVDACRCPRTAHAFD